jgi:hypothetical protein
VSEIGQLKERLAAALPRLPALRAALAAARPALLWSTEGADGAFGRLLRALGERELALDDAPR